MAMSKSVFRNVGSLFSMHLFTYSSMHLGTAELVKPSRKAIFVESEFLPDDSAQTKTKFSVLSRQSIFCASYYWIYFISRFCFISPCHCRTCYAFRRADVFRERDLVPESNKPERCKSFKVNESHSRSITPRQTQRLLSDEVHDHLL